jgi:hypothetical protein
MERHRAELLTGHPERHEASAARAVAISSRSRMSIQPNDSRSVTISCPSLPLRKIV